MIQDIPDDVDKFEKELENVKDVNIGDSIITKEEVKRNVSKRGLYLMQRFFKAGMMRSKYNNIMMQIYFHSLMGAFLKDYSVVKPGGLTDLRIPIIWIQNSRSGKSQMNKFMVDLAHRIGVSAVVDTGITEAGLIGTYDGHKHEWNVKNGLTKGTTKIKKLKGGEEVTLQYQDPVIRGDLGKEDIVLIDEAKIILQANKYSENLLSTLQPALDHPGKVRKKLSHEEPIEYDCECTLVSTTTDFKELSADLLKQGFFARCLLFNRKLSVQQLRQMHQLVSKDFFDDVIYRKTLDEFSDIIENSNFPILRERRRIVISDDLLALSSDTIQKWFAMIETTMYGSELEVMQSLASGMSVFIFKIAGQMAVINNRIKNNETKNWPNVTFEVTEEDLRYAINLLNPLFVSLTQNIRVGDNPTDQITHSIAIRVMNEIVKYDKNKQMDKNTALDVIMKHSGCGLSKSRKYYQEMITANYISEKKEGKIIIIIPNWYLWRKDYKTLQKSININKKTAYGEAPNMEGY
jgi:DNA-directed RNA polymerase subunit F